MTLRGAVKWGGLALLGLAIAVGVAIAASSLVSRQIGLASEPISVGRELAPGVTEQRERPAGEPGGPPAAPGAPSVAAPTAPSPSAAPSSPETDHDGETGDGDSDD